MPVCSPTSNLTHMNRRFEAISRFWSLNPTRASRASRLPLTLRKTNIWFDSSSLVCIRCLENRSRLRFDSHYIANRQASLPLNRFADLFSIRGSSTHFPTERNPGLASFELVHLDVPLHVRDLVTRSKLSFLDAASCLIPLWKL